MSKRKNEITPAAIDRDYPHQIVLVAGPQDIKRALEIRAFCDQLSVAPRVHFLQHNDISYIVRCFRLEADALAFQAKYGGQRFDPRERGRGKNWFRWEKGPTS